MAGHDCARCGQRHPRGCTGHIKAKDDDGRIVFDDHGNAVIDRPCAQYPMSGQTVCRFHGGAARHARTAGERNVTEQQARRELGRLTIVPVDNPLEELSKLAGEVVAWKDLLAAQVAELTSLTSGTGDTDSGRGPVLADADTIRAEIVLFERALDRCLAVLGQIARLNIDERLATIRGAQLRQVSDALTAALREHGLDTAGQRAVVASLGRHLRAVG